MAVQVQALGRVLDRVTAATIAMAEAEAEYNEALLAALNAGAGYSETARAAGTTRQTIHSFALREWPPAKRRLARTRRRRTHPRVVKEAS